MRRRGFAGGGWVGCGVGQVGFVPRVTVISTVVPLRSTVDGDLVAGLMLGDGHAEVGGLVDRVAVESDHDVTDLQVAGGGA